MKRKLMRLAANLSILFITILLFLVICEAGSRIVFGHSLEFTYTKDTLWELEPNQEGFTIPNKNFATINQQGIRETINVNPNPELRIVMLGDSFTFGWGIEDNETMASQLSRLIKDAEVLNLGVPGYGIFQMIELYNKKKVNELTYTIDMVSLEEVHEKPSEIVILTIMEDDMLRQPSEVMEQKGLVGKQRIRDLARAILRKSTFAAVMKPKVKRFFGGIFGLSKEKELFWQEFWEIDKQRIIDFKNLLESQDKILVIVPYIYKSGQEDFLRIIADFSKENNIIYVDNIGQRLFDFQNKLPLRFKEGHPNALSYQIASEAIYEELLENNII